MTGEGHEGKSYELAGDGAWMLSELAAEISRRTGRPTTSLSVAVSDALAQCS